MGIRIYCYTYSACRNKYIMQVEFNNGLDYKEIKITGKQFKELKNIGISNYTKKVS